MKTIGAYKNGNYNVILFDNGTKIRQTDDDEFIPAFSENCDIKITNYCDMHCPMCHEDSTEDGQHADILNAKFLDTLHPYTELAIGGGDPTSHPDLIPFLTKLKQKRVIANLTVNQTHFMQKQDLINQLVNEKLIYGLGISLTAPTDDFIEQVKKYPNAVVHVINGRFTTLDRDALANQELKLLILGYKEIRRGESYYKINRRHIDKQMKALQIALPDMIKEFSVVSFDNLAIEQLNVRSLMSEEEWNEFYMGDDGSSTFYIDMVRQEFAKSSTSMSRFQMLDSIDDMFQCIVSNERVRENVIKTIQHNFEKTFANMLEEV